MQVFDSIMSVLRQKEHGVIWVTPDTTVDAALRLLSEKEIGCLLVLEAGELVGVFSERDYARKTSRFGQSVDEPKVGELMSSPAVTIAPDTSVNEAMRLMTQTRERHLPVIDKGKLIGVVSIGDLVKWIISSQSQTICELQNYIAGKYDMSAANATASNY